jgi:hypothetical protein
MKETRKLMSVVITAAVTLSMASTLVAQPQAVVEGTAKVIRIKGAARYFVGSTTNIPRDLTLGTVLRPGSIIQIGTEQGSYVDLVLGEGNGSASHIVAGGPQVASYTPYVPTSYTPGIAARPSGEQNVVRVWENTVLGIDKLTSQQTGADVVTDTQLDLRAGHITGNVKKLSAGSHYEIKLPNGVAGVRGSSYDVTSDGVLQVLVGAMIIAWEKAGTIMTQVVTGGNQFDTRTGVLTPISQTALKMLEQILAAIRSTQAGAAPMTYASDKTVINVSPVVGP